MQQTALVVPSIREDSLARFIDEWSKVGLFDRIDCFVLVEDNPTKTFDLEGLFSKIKRKWKYKPSIEHFSWKEIDEQLGSRSWIIPRRSDTVRSFGYWWVWAQRGIAHSAHSPTYEYLMTLDDDCYPEKGYESLDDIHTDFLTRTKWFNTLNSVRPRGTPYKNLGTRDVYVNHGLWTNVLDYDGPQQLVNPIPEVFSHDNRIVPHGSFFSFCGMNWMCRREAIPLMYHLLMGKGIRSVWDHRAKEDARSGTDENWDMEPFPFDRFGDIWCGIIMKKIADHLGWAVSSGTPYVHHDRASNPFKNLRKEANGIEVNEWFWEKIDAVKLSGLDSHDLDGTIHHWDDPLECYCEIAKAIGTWTADEHAWYWDVLSQAMILWTKLFVEPEID